MAVIVLGIRIRDGSARAEHVGVGDVEGGPGAIDVGAVGHAERNPGTEQVLFGERDAALVLAAFAAGAQAHVERPGVARQDFDIGHAVAYRERPDGHVVQVVVAAQQPFRLRDLLHRDRLAAFEQQRPPDDVRARFEVQLVGEAEEEIVLPRVVQVEDVPGVDADFADTRARRLERGERGKGLRLLRAGRAGCSGQGREANEQAILN
jgi:hypothetical protein